MDPDRLDEIVAAIPPGRWMSYGDVAHAAGGTDQHARALNQRFIRSATPGAHRVLKCDGTVGGTALGDPARGAPPPRVRGARVRRAAAPTRGAPAPGPRSRRAVAASRARPRRRRRIARERPAPATGLNAARSQWPRAPAAAAPDRSRTWSSGSRAPASRSALALRGARRCGRRAATRGRCRPSAARSSRRPASRSTPAVRARAARRGAARWSRAPACRRRRPVVAAARDARARRGRRARGRLAARAERADRGHGLQRQDDDGRADRPPPPRGRSAVAVVGQRRHGAVLARRRRLPATATVVCEASSFQLEDTERFAPDAAVLLNLAEDHLDRHGTFDAYRAAKLEVFARQPAERRRRRAGGARRRRTARRRARARLRSATGARRRARRARRARCGGTGSG